MDFPPSLSCNHGLESGDEEAWQGWVGRVAWPCCCPVAHGPGEMDSPRGHAVLSQDPQREVPRDSPQVCGFLADAVDAPSCVPRAHLC